MKLMIYPDAEPVAHHTPVPVPIQWRDAVKAGLDNDVQLGVIEPVPVGKPVTWCHMNGYLRKEKLQTTANR